MIYQGSPLAPPMLESKETGVLGGRQQSQVRGQGTQFTRHLKGFTRILGKTQEDRVPKRTESHSITRGFFSTS